MKNRTLKTALAGLLLFAVGCSQDPLAGKDQRFKEGQKEKTEPVFEKPVSSEAIVFRTPDMVTFEEDSETEFDISAQVLIPDYVTELKIENLNEFPNAKYDPATGKFKWKPERGFVSGAGGSNILKRKMLLRATAMKTDAPVLFREREINIYVTRDYVEPTITLVRKDANALREGYNMYVRIRVKDLDANEADRNTWPEVQFSRYGNNKGLMGFIDFYRADKVAANEFELTYRVDLSQAELTSSGQDFTTAFQAVSRYGKKSQQQTMTVTVFTSFNEPSTSWTQTQDFKALEKRSYQFVIFDPKGEARLAPPTWRDIPAGANVSCAVSPDSQAILVCNMEWLPTEDQAGKQAYINAIVQVRNADSRDTSIQSFNVYLSYRVSPANFIPAQGKGE